MNMLTHVKPVQSTAYAFSELAPGFSGYIDMLALHLVEQSRADLSAAEVLAKSLKKTSTQVQKFVNGDMDSISASLKPFIVASQNDIAHRINVHYWDRFYNESNLGALMDPEQIETWQKTRLAAGTHVPEFSLAAIQDQTAAFASEAHAVLTKRIAKAFQKLSKDHVTNSAFGFRTRLIFDNCSRELETKIFENKSGYVHELRCLIALLSGDQEIPTRRTTQEILYQIFNNTGTWWNADNNRFRIKGFKKQTVHVEVDQDVAEVLNSFLAQHYPNCLPNTQRKNRKSDRSTKISPRSLCISHGARDIISCVHTKKLRTTSIYQAKLNCYHMLSTQLGYLTEACNIISECLNIQPAVSENGKEYTWTTGESNPVPVLKHLSLVGELPEQHSHQFYESTSKVINSVQNILLKLGINKGSRCLEPQAGRGKLADLLPQENTQCVEINALNARILEMKGYKVHCVDLFDFARKSQDKFDFIVSNPPYYHGTYINHVRACLPLLSPGGSFIGVVPGTYLEEFFDEDGLYTVTEHERYGEKFDGTGLVNVAIIEITRTNVF